MVTLVGVVYVWCIYCGIVWSMGVMGIMDVCGGYYIVVWEMW